MRASLPGATNWTRRERALTKLIVALTCLGLLLLTSCGSLGPINLKIDLTCTVGPPVPLPATIDWIGKGGAPPEAVQRELNDLNRQNEKILVNCPPPPTTSPGVWK